MCLNPIPIKNPNRGSKVLSSYKDTTSMYIYVPCNYCKECVAVRQMYFVQRFRMEALNSFLYFCTLTYDNEHLPKLTTSSGYSIPFCDVKHLQLLFKRLRNTNAFRRPFRYFAVTERGSEGHRPHAHILFFLPMKQGEFYSDGLSLQSLLYDSVKSFWSVNIGSDKFPIYEPLFTFQSKFYRGKLYRNYDLHFVTPSLTSSGLNSLAFYCCKYFFKYNSYEQKLRSAFALNLPEDEYLASWNLVRSRALFSRSFGLGASHNHDMIYDYLHSCIARSDRSLHYPQFFTPDSSQSFPLAPFYKNNGKILPFETALEFIDNPYTEFSKTPQDYKMAVSEYDRISSIVDKDLSIQFDFLFD